MNWNDELVAQLDFAWEHLFWPRQAGLTDAEYFWEPVPGCWSIRLDEHGTPVADWEFPEPTPPPVTTIGWRLAHLGVGVFGMRAAAHFGTGPGTAWLTDGLYDFHNVEWPHSATAGLALLDEAHAAWRDGVRGLGEDGLARRCGPVEGPFSEYSMAALVLHLNREFIHHGAEISLLRDLHRDTNGATRLQ